ncbi:MAG: FG-GAP repeat protein, partial [candidate division Zixibacteria bacterium]|nr:FG-GAP repeat protein [candidate division Zixibacteria bacterium]
MISRSFSNRRPSVYWLILLISISLHTNAFGQYNLLVQKDGAVAGDKLGWSVAGAGDVNGDGVPDYLIGMPYCDPSGMTSAGSAIVYSGASGAILFRKDGAAINEGLGYYVSGTGDVNGDGRADFIVTNQTQAFVYSGANGGLLHQKAAGGPVAGASDVNGDGYADFMISNFSQTSVYSGATGDLLYQKTGGSAIAGIGDIDGDGKADFIVCDHYADPGFTNGGSAYVYSGATGSLLYQKNGHLDYDLFGSSAAGAGDVNGDGTPDFIVGARLADLQNSGAAYVYSGATGTLLYQKNGEADEQWGHSVSGAGDVNGDGRADFLVGSIYADPAGHSSAGSVFLFSGATGNLMQRFDGTVTYENFGYAMSSIGDLNGNGRSAFIIGGPNAHPGGRSRAGSAYIYGDGDLGDPCDSDVIVPTLVCQADKQIGCGESVVFDEPTATDNCDPSP